MSTTITRVEDIPKLKHAEAMDLAKAEYERFAQLLKSLSEKDWSRPTDCDRWDVAGVTSHLVAMSQAFGSFPRELMRQQKGGKPLVAELGLSKFDAWTEYQSRMHKGGENLVAAFEQHYPRALQRRDRMRVVRVVRMPSPPYGWWAMSYLLDDVLTRDVWMHRVDISRATGRELVLTREHDGRLVANIVRDLGARWKRPFSLVLTGPAGGRFVNGEGAQEITLDAVEFCRILSGRSQGHGLPTDVVPF